MGRLFPGPIQLKMVRRGRLGSRTSNYTLICDLLLDVDVFSREYCGNPLAGVSITVDRIHRIASMSDLTRESVLNAAAVRSHVQHVVPPLPTALARAYVDDRGPDKRPFPEFHSTNCRPSTRRVAATARRCRPANS